MLEPLAEDELGLLVLDGRALELAARDLQRERRQVLAGEIRRDVGRRELERVVRAQLHAYGVSGLGRPRLTTGNAVPQYCGAVSGIVQDSGGGEPLFGGRIVLKSTLPELCLTESCFPDAATGRRAPLPPRALGLVLRPRGRARLPAPRRGARPRPRWLRLRAARASCTASGASRPARFLNFHTPDGGFCREPAAARNRGEPGGFDSVDAEPGSGVPPTEAILLTGRRGRGARDQPSRRDDQDRPRGALPDRVRARADFEGPDVHSHDDHVDSFYVLDGEVGFTVERRELRRRRPAPSSPRRRASRTASRAARAAAACSTSTRRAQASTSGCAR